ncbi:hypothetical protein A9Z42_0065260 [Trichoderma parareesei]|uniref:Uncharacterized protein n=1 Tax=Trichoderma parareesei TaxID=858221 RepID=A0A2H2ZG06_TRIPA|nr:hypothetical protein A9Z42_0065260 [Trichoderma parareesei]
MAQIIIDTSSAEPTFFRESDVYNDRQKDSRQGLKGLSATQPCIRQLQGKDLCHYIKLDDDNI